MKFSTLQAAVKAAGIKNVAESCGISERAVYRWFEKDTLPKDVYFNLKDYDEKIAKLLDYKLTAEQVRELGNPKKLVKH